MSHPKNQRNQNQPTGKIPVDQEMVKSFLEREKEKIALETLRTRLQEKELEANSKLAEKSMELNAQLLGKRPFEHRKTTKTYAFAIGCILFLVLAFFIACLLMDKEEFLVSLLKNLKDLAIAAISYFVGRATKKSKKSESTGNQSQVEDAEIVDE